MIAKRLAYMPKARNRNREREEEQSRQADNTGVRVIGYTLEEERMLDAQSGGANLLANSEKAAAAEGSTGPTSSAQEMSKKSASMWLQSRMKNGSGNNSGERRRVPGAAAAGMQGIQPNSPFKSKHDTRYSSNSSLPYALPPGNDEDARAVAKSAMDAKSDASSPKMKNRLENSARRSNFNEFMRSTHFASKPNSLVRQCVHCQLLYSTSHVCPSNAPSSGAEFKAEAK